MAPFPTSPAITVTAPSRPRTSPNSSRQNSYSNQSPRPPRSPTNGSFSIRPGLKGRSGGGNGTESYYMASASGSQTEGGDAGDGSSSSESEVDDEVLRARMRGLGGALNDSGLGSDLGRRGSQLMTSLSGDRGRGGHVLVEKRSLSPASMRERIKSGSEPKRERSWGTALLETLEGNNHSYREKRRPSSPSVTTARYPRPSPRGRPLRSANESPPREASPPLTMDSLNSSYNPFSLFHIRTHLIFEVVILLIPFLFAIYRLYTMLPTALFPSVPFIPIRSLLLLAVSVPFIALFRRDSHYFQAPFTDERGYRDPKQADDGVAAALTLPILLASAVWWDTYSNADETGGGMGLEGIRSLIEVWEAHGVHAINSTTSIDLSVLNSPVERARALFTSRHQLVLLTSLNAVCLLIHLVMSRTVFQIEKLPKSNTKRFFGFMGVAAGVSTTVWILFSAWDYLIGGESLSAHLSFRVSIDISASHIVE